MLYGPDGSLLNSDDVKRSSGIKMPFGDFDENQDPDMAFLIVKPRIEELAKTMVRFAMQESNWLTHEQMNTMYEKDSDIINKYTGSVGYMYFNVFVGPHIKTLQPLLNLYITTQFPDKSDVDMIVPKAYAEKVASIFYGVLNVKYSFSIVNTDVVYKMYQNSGIWQFVKRLNRGEDY